MIDILQVENFDTSVDSIDRCLAGILLVQIYDTNFRVKHAFILAISSFLFHIFHTDLHVSHSHFLRIDWQNFAKM